MYNAPGSVPVSRRRSGTPGGASIDDSVLANMIFDTPPKSSSGGGGMGGVNNNSGNFGGGGSGSNLQKSPHHKSTSALSEVQTNNSTASASSGKRGSTTSAPYAGSSAGHAGRSHTLAVTDSPSYLSSISVGMYADDYEGASPPSSGISSANTSFTSSSYGGNHSNTHGSHHGTTIGGSGFRGGFDLGDDIMQHYAGSSGGNSHSSSPTGYSTVSHGSGSGSSGHHHRSDVASGGSPVTHYKKASSPILTGPTDTHKGNIAGHGDRVGGGGGGSGKHAHHHHHQYHHSHAKDIKRSRSPDLQHHHLMAGFSSSYHAPSTLDQHPNNAAASSYRHHASVQQHPSGGMTRAGGVSPTLYIQGQGGVPSSAGGRGDLQCHKTSGWVEDRKSPVQRHATIAGGDFSHHHHHHQQQHQQHGHKSGGQVRNPNSHSPSLGVKDSANNPYRGSRKASDQEMGIMEALTMMDKRGANSNKFDDGTLV